MHFVFHGFASLKPRSSICNFFATQPTRHDNTMHKILEKHSHKK